MTRQRTFKRLVRSRMAKTGESYVTARAAMLAAEGPQKPEGPPLATSDEAIRRRTGRGWEEWFDLLDDWDATERSHREIARWVAEQLKIEPLVWEAQAITVSYERARGLRAVGERAEGFAVTAQKTVAVPAGRLFDAFVDASLRDRCLPGADLTERTATRPTVAHFDWAGGDTRLNVTFVAKGDSRSMAAVEHTRLGNAQEAERMKAYWRAALATLKAELEAGASDA